MLLIPEILDAIDLRVLRLEGVHRPRVSTTRGKKEPPAALRELRGECLLKLLPLQLLHQH